MHEELNHMIRNLKTNTLKIILLVVNTIYYRGECSNLEVDEGGIQEQTRKPPRTEC